MNESSDITRQKRTGAGNGPSFIAEGWQRLKGLFQRRNGDHGLRESLEELIEEWEESNNGSEGAGEAIGKDERVMLSNILKLRHLSAYDVMVPRADIIAVELGASLSNVLGLMRRHGHSRMPVFRSMLDEVVGFVHIKDVLEYVETGRRFDLADVLRRVLMIAPSMRVLDLLLEMRLSRVHMALVVDEFGGVDGLITIEDLVEEIVGEIEDEHDVALGPKLIPRPDGVLIADGRATVEEFEDLVGPVLSEEQRGEDIDTLGGLVFHIAGRVPTRGEVVEDETSRIVFEILEADPRRVKRVRVRNLPERKAAGEEGAS